VAPAAQRQDGYTLVHAGKQVRFGPVAFWIVVGTVTVLGMWSAATATYFAFRDDVLTRLIARQAEMQYAYEDRIAELRAKVDRTTSRQLLDQEQFDQKLEQIMRRQTALESRATALGAIPDTSVTGSIRMPSRGAASGDAGSSGTPKPSPISDTVIFVAPPDREARLESRAPIVPAAQPNQFAKVRGVDNVLVRLQTSLDKVESRQIAALGAIEDGMESRVRRMRGVFSDLGLDMAQLSAATPRAAMGGPFVPGKLSADASSTGSTSPAPRWSASTGPLRWCRTASRWSAKSNSLPVSAFAAIPSSVARPCIPVSIFARRPAIPCVRPRMEKWCRRDGAAVTAEWWK
jgi:TolA-binding protein